MSKSLKIASLPFCAIVTSAPNAQIAVVQQVGKKQNTISFFYCLPVQTALANSTDVNSSF
jgi:hypothetical protein